MAEYVKIKDVKRMLQSLEACAAEYGSCTEVWNIAIDTAIARLDNLPAADVQEVKHGEWSDEMISKNGYKIVETTTGSLVIPSKYTYVPDHQLGFQCSSCGALMKNKTTYCGNCGAKMDGKDGENND